MTAYASDALAPRSCRARDLTALIGLLAVLEGELMAGEVSQHLSDRIRHRLQSAAVLEPGGTERHLRQSINDLNHRLRYALGEYDEPPSSSDADQRNETVARTQFSGGIRGRTEIS